MRILKWVGIAFVVLIIIALVSGGDDDDSNDTTSGNTDTAAEGGEDPPQQASGPGLNTPVRDGKFEFVVKSIDCGSKQIGSSSFGVQAQGQFCMLNINVKNIGKEAQTLDGGGQKLIDSQGREFSANSSAAIYLDDSKTFLEQINPGNAVDGTVVFDVPVDAEPVTAELHDSIFSGGVKVNLS